MWVAAWTILALLLAAATADPAEEKLVNTAHATVYLCTVHQWHSTVVYQFRQALSVAADSYCSSNADACHLEEDWKDGGSFSVNDVVVLDDFPTYKKPYLKASFSVMLPTGVANNEEYLKAGSPTRFYVHSDTLQAISLQGASVFHNQSGYHIIGVNDLDLSIPPNQPLNIALSIAAVGLVGLCLGVGLILEWRCGGYHVPVTHSDSDDEDDAATSKNKPIEMDTIGFSTLEAVKTADSQAKINNGGESKA